MFTFERRNILTYIFAIRVPLQTMNLEILLLGKFCEYKFRFILAQSSLANQIARKYRQLCRQNLTIVARAHCRYYRCICSSDV